MDRVFESSALLFHVPQRPLLRLHRNQTRTTWPGQENLRCMMLHIAFLMLRAWTDASPAPTWIVRHHAPIPVHTVALINQGNLLVAGDAEGRVSVTTLLTYRPIVFWQAHKGAVLRADAWSGFLVTHGRDHSLRVWEMPEELGSVALSSSMAKDLPVPTMLHEMGVNALNYCAYDMCIRNASTATLDGWLVVPNTLESAWIDVYHVPSKRRIIESLGRQGDIRSGAERPAIVMALQMCIVQDLLWIVAGYEDGALQAWTIRVSTMEPTLAWTHKCHAESIMALCLSPTSDSVLSLGADYHLVRTALHHGAVPQIQRIKRPGHACASIRWDRRVCVLGGWDASVRVFTWPSLEPLAKLTYHKDSIYALSFVRRDAVHVLHAQLDESSDEDAEESPTSKQFLLACASKDGRISLWNVPFTETPSGMF